MVGDTTEMGHQKRRSFGSIISLANMFEFEVFIRHPSRNVELEAHLSVSFQKGS